MKDKNTQMWIPLYVDKWIFGSTRIELDPAERSVFIDLMAFGAKDNGFIRANEITPYPHKHLAGILNIEVSLLESTLEKCKKFNKITEEVTGIYKLCNWEEYQLSPRYINKVVDKETGEIISESKFIDKICGYLESSKIPFKREKVCDGGRIDIYLETNPPIIIEVKSTACAEHIRSGVRQLLEYGIAIPKAILCIALPIEQKNEISGDINERLKKYHIELLTISNFSRQIAEIIRQKEAIREDKRIEEKIIHTTTAPDKLVADVVDKSLPVNWENCRSDHQRFIAYYVAKEMPELYKNATQAQANGLFKRYGRAASEVLSVSGDIDTARAAFDLGRAYFVQKGLPWNLSTISKNIGEFVNSVITNKRSIK